MRDIARRCCRPNADGLVMGIDPVEITVESSRAFTEPVQLVDDVCDEIVDHLPERLRGHERLDETATGAGEGVGKDRVDRLGECSQRLVETAMQIASKSLGERPTRCADQLLDPLETQLPQAIRHIGVEPQR